MEGRTNFKNYIFKRVNFYREFVPESIQSSQPQHPGSDYKTDEDFSDGTVSVIGEEDSFEFDQINYNSEANSPGDDHMDGREVGSGGGGLENFFNNCYLNSAIQILFGFKETRSEILRRVGEGDGLLESLALLFGSMTKQRTSNPIGVKYQLEKHYQDYYGSRQHDFYETFQKIIDVCDQESTSDPSSNGQSFIKSIFSFVMMEAHECQSCKKKTARNIPVLAGIPVHFDFESWELQSLLRKATNLSEYRDEKICGSCSLRGASYSSALITVPKILVIHLCRFHGNGQKDDRSIRIQKNIELDSENSKATYDLQAVVLHEGSTDGGHYYACVKSLEDGQWRKFDDQFITQIPDADFSGPSPYVLFYRNISEIEKIPLSAQEQLHEQEPSQQQGQDEKMENSAGQFAAPQVENVAAEDPNSKQDEEPDEIQIYLLRFADKDSEPLEVNCSSFDSIETILEATGEEAYNGYSLYLVSKEEGSSSAAAAVAKIPRVLKRSEKIGQAREIVAYKGEIEMKFINIETNKESEETLLLQTEIDRIESLETDGILEKSLDEIDLFVCSKNESGQTSFSPLDLGSSNQLLTIQCYPDGIIYWKEKKVVKTVVESLDEPHSLLEISGFDIGTGFVGQIRGMIAEKTGQSKESIMLGLRTAKQGESSFVYFLSWKYDALALNQFSIDGDSLPQEEPRIVFKTIESNSMSVIEMSSSKGKAIKSHIFATISFKNDVPMNSIQFKVHGTKWFVPVFEDQVDSASAKVIIEEFKRICSSVAEETLFKYIWKIRKDESNSKFMVTTLTYFEKKMSNLAEILVEIAKKN